MYVQEEFVCGVDVGSTQAKAVIISESGKILGTGLCDVLADVAGAARQVYESALGEAGLRANEIAYVVGTGYGRFRIAFGDFQITEISCHAKGAKYLFPQTKSVIDVGGQDTKAIRVGAEGNVLDFTMNDKCSAGTGRFLGAAAMVLDIPVSKLGELAMKSKSAVKITTTCTVFAESEIISYLAKGRKTEDILMGMHESIAQRTISLARRVGVESEVTFTGGVSKNKCMVEMLQNLLETPVNVSPQSQYTGALGAALFGLERLGGHSEGALGTQTQGSPSGQH